jgi:hypothetical protein
MVESKDLSAARKVRADAGKTIFNSDKKRMSTYNSRFRFLQKKRTNGCITWRQLTTQVSGGDGQVRPFSGKTLREFVMGLPNSSYNSIRIFPLLDKKSTER